jgi:hypothetical protein
VKLNGTWNLILVFSKSAGMEWHDNHIRFARLGLAAAEIAALFTWVGQAAFLSLALIGVVGAVLAAAALPETRVLGGVSWVACLGWVEILV